ncbi:MAG: hypothetical protein GY822_28265 [Deltaproteobacteria bacterium]|nr:hypothetical protein [Deltaproteobacteria bacterium]
MFSPLRSSRSPTFMCFTSLVGMLRCSSSFAQAPDEELVSDFKANANAEKEDVSKKKEDNELL